MAGLERRNARVDEFSRVSNNEGAILRLEESRRGLVLA